VTRVLAVNAGSSSLKLSLVDADDHLLLDVTLPVRQGRFDTGALAAALEPVLSQVDAVGHRVVHGGTRFLGPVIIDRSTEEALRALTELAPLHQPLSLAGIDAVAALRPGTPTVACFDTAFHATLPAAASTYAVPAAWRDELGVRRYGFHGLSHAYAARRAAALLGPSPDPVPALRLVTCHLGAGASLAAVAGGVSVDTTMGFTPLEGLVMATRSGTVDPGLVTWLIDRHGVHADEVADALEHRSGLFALSGTSDMAAVVSAADRGEKQATLALDVYVHRLRAAIAAMAAAMGGVDALVFTAGVGEHAPVVRRRAAGGLGFLGVALDEAANARAVPDAEISAPGARVRTLVVAAREDLEIARQVRTVLATAPGGTPAVPRVAAP